MSSFPTVVNYRRRIGDNTTALMVAAFHGDVDAVRYFLSLGAKASFVDTWGKTVALLAEMRGQEECFAELQRVADEESARGKKIRVVHDFGYVIYYFSPAESRATPLGRRRLALLRSSHRPNKNHFLVLSVLWQNNAIGSLLNISNAISWKFRADRQTWSPSLPRHRRHARSSQNCA